MNGDLVVRKSLPTTSQLHSDPAVNFLSEAFDAEKALATPGLQPPDSDAPTLDYMAKCRVLLPADMPESLAGKERAAGEKCGNEATRQKHEGMKGKAAQVLQRIQQSCRVSLEGVMAHVKGASPAAALQRWRQGGHRVRVVTRHASGVRGVAEGRLVAFDAYMNVVLQDVQEKYTVIVRVQKQWSTEEGKWCLLESTQEPTGKTKWVRQQEQRQRQLGQVFIKGDSVVVISCATASPAAAAPSATQPHTQAGGVKTTTLAGTQDVVQAPHKLP